MLESATLPSAVLSHCLAQSPQLSQVRPGTSEPHRAGVQYLAWPDASEIAPLPLCRAVRRRFPSEEILPNPEKPTALPLPFHHTRGPGRQRFGTGRNASVPLEIPEGDRTPLHAPTPGHGASTPPSRLPCHPNGRSLPVRHGAWLCDVGFSNRSSSCDRGVRQAELDDSHIGRNLQPVGLRSLARLPAYSFRDVLPAAFPDSRHLQTGFAQQTRVVSARSLPVQPVIETRATARRPNPSHRPFDDRIFREPVDQQRRNATSSLFRGFVGVPPCPPNLLWIP